MSFTGETCFKMNSFTIKIVFGNSLIKLSVLYDQTKI